MIETTPSERLEAARRKFQELKKRNEHLFKANSAPLSQSTASHIAESNAVDVAELKSTIEQQKATIKKLRDENTDLKLERMDLSDKVSELEQQLSKLRSSQPPPPQISSPQRSTPHFPVSSPQRQATADALPQSQTSSSDIREHMMRWKHWGVDMRDWNGSKYTQIVL